MSRPMLFGKYCLLERISVGGMAEVFRAKPLNSPDTDRFLALKRILPHLAEDDEFLRMFVDEAKLCVHLRHPNIVHIYELGRFQSSSYILMEFIPGQDLLSLQKRLRQRRLIMSVAQACYIAMELAKGLDYAHKATDDYGRPLGIIHRDISPQNVLINYAGQVKLIDFGVAKAAIQSTKTQVGVLKGKFGYMSPEQIRGEGQIDRRSDIFAVGTVLWELLTNRRLFTGDNEYEIFNKVREARADLPSSKNPQIPAEVDRIVMKALALETADRYQNAHELARDLGMFLTSIEPLYTQQMLAEWMSRFFEEELASERQKVSEFRSIRTADDVQRAFVGSQAPIDITDAHLGPAPTAPPADMEDAAAATQIWDADIAPSANEDIAAFAAAHTVVAAGGFDLDEFMALREDDILESRDEVHPLEEETRELNAYHSAALRESVATQANPSISNAFSTKIDGGGTQPRGQITTAMLAAAKRRRNSRALLAAALVACCVLLALTSTVLLLTSGSSDAAQTDPRPEVVPPTPEVAAVGTLLLTSTPSDELTITIDGERRPERSTPLTLEGIEAGEHSVVIEHAGHLPHSGSVQVGAGALVPLDVVLRAE